MQLMLKYKEGTRSIDFDMVHPATVLTKEEKIV